MSLLVEFDEFQNVSNEQFNAELDNILLQTLSKLRDIPPSDLRRRLCVIKILEKVLKCRHVEMDQPMEIGEKEEETY
ncbi:unnamed protein product [Caenorhabditis sp. 36 PRJEB53466]|nr:unnamed protein product [Caenorhabditis sp. 36 PRJEB53466]